MNENHYFTCPKCGGHYFGRDTADGGVMLATVQCHSTTEGKGIMALDEWVAAGKPKQKWCKWRGEWPVKPVAGGVDAVATDKWLID